MAGEHFEEMERSDGQKVKKLMPDYLAGPEEASYQSRKNITYVNMDQKSDPIKKYLTTAERYFYSKEWFGSEKRKNPD